MMTDMPAAVIGANPRLFGFDFEPPFGGDVGEGKVDVAGNP